MSIITLGLGSYTTALPLGETGVLTFQGQVVSPLIASNFSDVVPTNDWISSVIFPYFGNQYSAPIFAQPLNMQADSSGLNLGYTATPTFFYDGSGRQVKFEYTYHADLNISLAGMNSANTVLENTSAYFNKTLWQDSDSSNQLHATFGHGSPFTYFERTGDADVVINLTAHNSNTIGQPNASNEVFKIDHVNGTYNGGQLTMDLLVNAVDGQGSHIANAVEARISIDTNGDGKFDYVKTMNYLPVDGDANNTEHYTQNEARGLGASETGQLQNLNNATIQVEVWKAFGTGDIQVQVGMSNVVLPFNNLTDSNGVLANTLYLANDGTQNLLSTHQPAVESIVLGAAPVEEAVQWDGVGTIYYYDHNVLGLTINGNHYGLFAPVGSEWHVDNGVITSDLNGKDYFSSALLPDQSIDTLQYFYQHAYAFVTDSQATFSYDAENSQVVTNFSVTTDLKESDFSADALTSLYPHQWLHSNDSLTQYTYQAPQGEMKLHEGNTFSTAIPYTGILPVLPNFLDAAETQQLANMIQGEYQYMSALPIVIPGKDSYWAGKAMARLGELAELADQVGNVDAKTFFVNAIKAELQDWFTVSNTEGDKQFYYNEQWGTLQAYPASFNSDSEINDHHFHYGYFIKAASVVAQFDPQWANEWGGMVELLIKDVANTDETNTLFPYLRNFDPYAGHSWASGHAAFFSGNNHESSSEALNFASAVTFWGAQTGNAALLDLGNYLYSTEVSAVQQYWFDINNMNFPDEFNHSEVGMVWGDGAVYGTWFSGEPEMIHGINFLPITAASLYLGLYPEYVAKNYAEMIQVNGGVPTEWKDIMMEYQALFNPAAAVASFTLNYTPEEGESLSHTYSWINNLNALGQVDRNITANTPFFSVFNKSGLITYVAYNPTDVAQEIIFSDGTHFTLQAEEILAMNIDRTWSSITGSIAHDPVSDPVPVPDPVIPLPDPVPVPDPVIPPPDPAPEPTHPDSQITGTINSEIITGTMASDVIYGLAGDDQLHGLDGNDVLYGGDGNDALYGREGDDVLIGGAGADFMNGGAGNDVFKYLALSDSEKSSPDFIQNFEQGNDKIDLSAFNIGFNQLAFRQENGYNFVDVIGTDFSIKIGDGYKTFTANDFILTGSSSDPAPQPVPTPIPTPTPVPAPTPTPAPSAADIMGTASGETLMGTVNNDVIYGLGGNDILHGNVGDDDLYGGEGNDTIHGNEGNDTLYGGAGNDHLYGNIGDDILIGGSGADFLVGGDGKNTYKYENLLDSTDDQRDTIEAFHHGVDILDLTLLHVNVDDIHIQAHNGIQTISITNTNFAVDLIASDPISHSDIAV